MNYIFDFIQKPYSLRINSQFKPEDPNDKIWHRNRKIWHRIFLQTNVSYHLAGGFYGKYKHLGLFWLILISFFLSILCDIVCLYFLLTVNKCAIKIMIMIIIINVKSFLERHFCGISKKNCPVYNHSDVLQS